jgi:E3 ubiquitin-protein ligase mind-bomb
MIAISDGIRGISVSEQSHTTSSSATPASSDLLDKNRSKDKKPSHSKNTTTSVTGDQSQEEKLRFLESKITEIEEAFCCSICMERVKNVVFLCGHGACDACSRNLLSCHMCRQPITRKIVIY